MTGLSFFDQSVSRFEFRAGPVFSNLLLADEINRATPRTQSALLECMAERQVTVVTRCPVIPDPGGVLPTVVEGKAVGVLS